MRKCQFCGKSSQKGNQISHSAVKTIKRTYPNLRVKCLEINGKKVKVKICAKCLKKISN
ncbi:MAG: 50S ribosomal protein L28 [Patescibacteria group bacterium]|nr:50S ribosomal protein L28 [Patescibacteria group bacterium]